MRTDERDFWYREGRTPIVRHMADRSYTIRAWVKDGEDTVEFEIYRVVSADFGPEGSVEGPVPAFWQRYGVTLRPCAVDSLDDAEREFFGGVKEVGCADWNLHGDLKVDHHVCRREQLEQISAVLCACYDWAPQLITPRQYSAPPAVTLPFLPETP
ncbi:MAG: hypothetical protein EOP88_13495 [Verrucomicrobiaceae bacterium]|nr:MAG: hypothetical protein EOP88_13495 [Verrucomicrobiaceae bacterium]